MIFGHMVTPMQAVSTSYLTPQVVFLASKCMFAHVAPFLRFPIMAVNNLTGWPNGCYPVASWFLRQ